MSKPVAFKRGDPDGNGDSEEDLVQRIRSDAPVLRPDEPVPVNPVL